MSFIEGTLSDFLQENKTVILKGFLRGGILTPFPLTVIGPDTPCTANFENVFENPQRRAFFLTLVPDCNRGQLAYFFELNRLTDQNTWTRLLGVAFLINENLLQLTANNAGRNETGWLSLAKFREECGERRRRLVLTYNIEEIIPNPLILFPPLLRTSAEIEDNVRLSNQCEKDETLGCFEPFKKCDKRCDKREEKCNDKKTKEKTEEKSEEKQDWKRKEWRAEWREEKQEEKRDDKHDDRRCDKCGGY